jgi:hypothetical protein
MKNLVKILIPVLILLVTSACATTRNPQKRKKTVIHVETTHLGKNKYFFSKKYQKSLSKRASKNRRRNKRR